MNFQRSLPEMLPECPSCHRPTHILGQWSPLWPYAVCRECSINHPYPLHIIAPSTRRNKAKEPLMIALDATREELEFRVLMEGWLRDAALGCKDAMESEWGDEPECWMHRYRPDCKRCAYRLHNTGSGKYARMGRGARIANLYGQYEIGICGRCGQVHDHHSDWITYSYCKSCTMLMSVEALHRHRGIFGDDDDETILDRIYVSHRELFEAGVLPDYWYELQGKVKA